MNPDYKLPARPGSFYDKGDAQRFKPHHATSKSKDKAVAAVGRAYPFQYTAGPVLLLFAFRPLH